MVQLGKKGARSEDDFGGAFDPPIPGRYHVVIEEVDESCEKYDAVIVDFTVKAGNKPDQEGKQLREFFSIKEKARDRLSRLAMCIGLLQPGEEKDVNFTEGVGRHLVIEVEAGTYEKDGETKNKVSISYAGMWSIGNKKVADVPKDAQALAASGQVKPKSSGERAEQATEAASVAAESSGADDDWGSLL